MSSQDNHIHVGDVGTKLKFSINIDLNEVTSASLLYRKPDGTTGTWTLTKEGDYLVYTTQSGDIDQSGVWELQLYIETSEWHGYSDKVLLNVKSHL